MSVALWQSSSVASGATCELKMRKVNIVAVQLRRKQVQESLDIPGFAARCTTMHKIVTQTLTLVRMSYV